MLTVIDKNPRNFTYILRCDDCAHTFEVSARAFLLAHLVECDICHGRELTYSVSKEPESDATKKAKEVLDELRQIR